MTKMKSLTAILVIIVTLTACGNRSMRPGLNIDYGNVDEDTLSMNSAVNDEPASATDKENGNSSESASSSYSDYRSSSLSSSRDNMRGFDPSSEDDLEDNGMSRFMENNDEEGWN